MGVNADQPSPYAHVINAAGLTWSTAGQGAPLPGVASPTQSFGLIFDPTINQYREVSYTNGAATLASAPVLSSFTYVPLSSVGSVSALGCSASLPQPTTAYSSAAVMQLQAANVAWWTFDNGLQDVTGRMGQTNATGTGGAPIEDDAVTRYGAGSLYLTPLSQYLAFPSFSLFTATVNSQLRSASFSVAAWVQLDPAVLTGSPQTFPIFGTSKGVGVDFGLYLTWNSYSNTGALHAGSSPLNTGISQPLLANLTAANLPSGVWTHLAMTWNASATNAVTVSFFANGTLLSSSTTAMIPLTGFVPAAAFTIGGGPLSSSFGGWLDDVVLFNSALPPLQMSQLAAYALPTLDQSLHPLRAGVCALTIIRRLRRHPRQQHQRHSHHHHHAGYDGDDGEDDRRAEWSAADNVFVLHADIPVIGDLDAALESDAVCQRIRPQPSDRQPRSHWIGLVHRPCGLVDPHCRYQEFGVHARIQPQSSGQQPGGVGTGRLYRLSPRCALPHRQQPALGVSGCQYEPPHTAGDAVHPQRCSLQPRGDAEGRTGRCRCSSAGSAGVRNRPSADLVGFERS